MGILFEKDNLKNHETRKKKKERVVRKKIRPSITPLEKKR